MVKGTSESFNGKEVQYMGRKKGGAGLSSSSHETHVPWQLTSFDCATRGSVLSPHTYMYFQSVGISLVIRAVYTRTVASGLLIFRRVV